MISSIDIIFLKIIGYLLIKIIQIIHLKIYFFVISVQIQEFFLYHPLLSR